MHTSEGTCIRIALKLLKLLSVVQYRYRDTHCTVSSSKYHILIHVDFRKTLILDLTILNVHVDILDF